MRAYRIKNVKRDNDGNVTIMHSKGAFHFKEEDVVLKEWTNNFLCRMDLPFMNKILFFCWWIGLSLGFYFVYIDAIYFDPLIKNYDSAFYLTDNISSLFILCSLVFILLRIIYFLFCRDYFKKALLFIHLKNNQSICLYDYRKHSYYSNITEGFSCFTLSLDNLNNSGIVKDREFSSDRGTKLFLGYFFFIIVCSFSFYCVYNNWNQYNINVSRGPQITLELTDKWVKQDIPSLYVFSLGMIVPILLIAIVVYFIVGFLLLTSILLGTLCSSIILFFRMIDDGREIHKIYVKYGKFVPLLWALLIFELYYFHHLGLIWLISISLFAVVIELFRLNAFRKISSNTEFYFSISQYNKLERGFEFFPGLFLTYYFPLLITFAFFLVPVFADSPRDTSNFIGVIIFAPTGLLSMLRFIFNDEYRNNEGRFIKLLNRNNVFKMYSLVKQSGLYLKDFSKQLKDLKRIVFKAVKNNGLALQFASEDLKNDKEIVLEAIRSNKDAIQFASENLKNDPEILAFLNDSNSEN